MASGILSEDTVNFGIGKIPMKLAGLLLLWTAIALIATTTAYLGMRGGSLDLWLSTLKRMLLYYYSWAVLSVVIFVLISKAIDGQLRPAVAALSNLIILLSVIFLMPFLVHFDEWRTWLYGAQSVGFQSLSVAIYLFVLMGCFALKYYLKSLTTERARVLAYERASALELDLNHAKVDLLKMQINPHFMFNALNSIGALIETGKNNEAYETTELLGSMLRQTLSLSEKTVTDFESELMVIETYIALESIRFGGRLSFTVDVDQNCLKCAIPILIMQPIIENTIKHAVGKTENKVSAHLRAVIEDSYLAITVEDDGPGFKFPIQPGIGHKNIKRRLEMLYGEEGLFSLKAREPSGAVVEIRVPV